MPTKKTKRKASKTAKVTSFFQSKNSLIAFSLILFAGVGTYLLFSSRAAGPVTTAPNPPTIYLSPTTQPLGINTTFTVEVRENSGTTAVNAVQANFSYPTALLDYVPTTAEVTTANPNGISFVGSAFDVAAEAIVDTATGNVKIARGVGGGASVTTDKLVAKLTFRSKTTGGAANLNFATSSALVSQSSSANLITGTNGSYGNAVYTIDTAAPTVGITAPVANATVSLGSTQTITATATDAASDVTKVEFYVDNVLKGSDTTSPYSYAWATTGVTEGSHSITAKAYDTYNNVATSTAVAVTVRDSTPPTVSITAPVANAVLSSTISITANASDNTGGKGLAKVEFYVDGVLKGTATTSPYTYAWDTKTATDASHSLTAKAYDAAATPNVTTSAAVAVTVDNSDRTAPTAPANLRTTGNTYTSVALAWNASTDNVAVTAYRLSRNGTVVYTGSALTFNNTGLTAGTSYTYSVVALDAANNVSAATTITASAKVQKVGDVNGDDLINVYDLSSLLSKWSTNDATCDLNKDAIVNVYDLSLLLSNWGK